MAKSGKPALTWSEPTRCGTSEFVTFGSLPNRRNAMIVYRTSRGGEELYAVRFNDGSRRQPRRELHPTAQAAKDHARACLSLPICPLGLKSRLLDATLAAIALCGRGASRAEALAAALLAKDDYPEVDAEAIARDICAPAA